MAGVWGVKRKKNEVCLEAGHLQMGLASQVGLMVKNAPATAGDARDMGPIPGLGGSPGEGNGNPL